jgi:hypothetical protein
VNASLKIYKPRYASLISRRGTLRHGKSLALELDPCLDIGGLNKDSFIVIDIQS